MSHLQRTVLAVILMAVLGGCSAMATEEAAYTVVLKEDPFELRRYDPHIIAETTVDADFEDAGSQAFGRLFKYISGNNTTRQEVDMTSPVGQASASQKLDMTSPVGQKKEGERWAVSFMMPAAFTLETLPVPNDPAVMLRRVPARHMATVRYSGFWSEKGYLRHKARLDAWIERRGFSTVGAPIWARYNPPFMPWFLRRNEILVPVADPEPSE